MKARVSFIIPLCAFALGILTVSMTVCGTQNNTPDSITVEKFTRDYFNHFNLFAQTLPEDNGIRQLQAWASEKIDSNQIVETPESLKNFSNDPQVIQSTESYQKILDEFLQTTDASIFAAEQVNNASVRLRGIFGKLIRHEYRTKNIGIPNRLQTPDPIPGETQDDYCKRWAEINKNLDAKDTQNQADFWDQRFSSLAFLQVIRDQTRKKMSEYQLSSEQQQVFTTYVLFMDEVYTSGANYNVIWKMD